MGLVDGGILTADTVLKGLGLMATVTHQAWLSQDGKGKATYAAAVSRQCVLDLTRKQRAGANGTLINVVATLIFLEVIAPNGAVGRREPIDPRDIIVLPDGTTGPILDDPDAVWDPANSRPFLNTVQIGEIASAP